MNFFQFKLDITKRRFKIFFLFILLLIIFLLLYTFSYSREKSSAEITITEGILTDEQFFGEYTYRCYTGPPFRENVFQIYKGEDLVYQSDIGYAYWLNKEKVLFQPGDDITGDGIPNLVVMHSGGGNSSFNQSCYVFSLGEQFRLIQGLPRGEFVDINQDGKLDCIAYQSGFTFWHACHAGSPLPKIVYEYCDNEYLLAPALMYQPLPNEGEMNRMVEEVISYCARAKKEKWQDNSCWRYQDVYLDSSVWRYMLDLMYAGHPDAAYAFLDKVWPEGEKGKSHFIYDFEKQLNRYTIWPALAPMFARIAQVKKEDPSASLEEELTQGVLYIWASPENTEVYVNNKYLGEAPLSTDFLAPGEYNLRLSQPGYYDIDITAEVVPLHIQKVEGSLKQKVGNSTLFISSTPEKAEAFLDDTYIGDTPLKVEKILAGMHRLVFMKPGYHLYEKPFAIYPAEDHEIIATLEEDKTVYAQEVIWIPLMIIIVLLFL
ncbi:PEGA domain-containing protein [bacterium]|nr:PEGA domain-containing protein [bacterium]